MKNAYDFPGFVPAYIRPLFCEGRGPFRWVALSGEASDIHVTDELVLELFPENRILRRWIDLARKRIKFQGLPARICWLGYGERAQFGLAMNDLVKKGKIKAPIVIGRDHLDCGSVASPFRETESMKDGSDAVADWPLLNALLNTAAGASWVSIHNGGGVGIGYSLHAGQVTVADGTDEMAKRIERVLTTDPGMGVIRHVDAGYDEAKEFAKKAGVKAMTECGSCHRLRSKAPRGLIATCSRVLMATSDGGEKSFASLARIDARRRSDPHRQRLFRQRVVHGLISWLLLIFVVPRERPALALVEARDPRVLVGESPGLQRLASGLLHAEGRDLAVEFGLRSRVRPRWSRRAEYPVR